LLRYLAAPRTPPETVSPQNLTKQPTAARRRDFHDELAAAKERRFLPSGQRMHIDERNTGREQIPAGRITEVLLRCPRVAYELVLTVTQSAARALINDERPTRSSLVGCAKPSATRRTCANGNEAAVVNTAVKCHIRIVS
jgi:hypothetical protein